MAWDTSGPWSAEVDEDDPESIALTAANGRVAYVLPISEARRIRDALNDLPFGTLGPRGLDRP
jgi:hypothetical protein